jgi:hypothetical protein
MDFESAKADCQRAVALAPGDLEAEGRLAQILLLKGKLPRRRRYLIGFTGSRRFYAHTDGMESIQAFLTQVEDSGVLTKRSKASAVRVPSTGLLIPV